MAETAADIPDRAFFKASEVCEIARVQPYVLRSWEQEFGNLGVARSSGGRIYRRSDIERVLRIKQLLFVEGLTLAGARRRLQEESGAAEADEAPLPEPVSADVKERLEGVKQELRSLLNLLSGEPRRVGQQANPWASRTPREQAVSRPEAPGEAKPAREPAVAKEQPPLPIDAGNGTLVRMPAGPRTSRAPRKKRPEGA